MRLTPEEVDRLDQYQKSREVGTRSEAVRLLVRQSVNVPEKSLDFPVSLRAQLEDVVEDGWARTLDEAVTLVATLGIQELSRLHAERLPALRRAARETASRSERRRRADQEGRELLDR
ncbi:MAG TPA: hypothetical protein VKT21_04730 [Thermoplasmata archaeon]|nr:hypothetical protein [Thermoplasmata archaeon]